MSIGEIGYIVSKYAIYFLEVVTSIYATYALYYAYLKSKDEREKSIVLYSMAKAFSIALILFLVYYVIQISVKVADVEQFTMLWNLLHFEMDEFTAGTAVSTMMAILGVCLFLINVRQELQGLYNAK